MVMICHSMRENTKTLYLCLGIASVLFINVVWCQSETELDEQFQDFHHDLGRISGGATNSPAQRSTTPIARPAHQQQQHHSEPAPQQPLVRSAQTHVGRSSSTATGSHVKPAVVVTQHHQRAQQQQQPKRNRVTLAVRPHTPAPSPIGQLESVAAPSAVLAITQPISQPVIPDYQQQSNQFASLMAQVAAERQQSNEARTDDFSTSLDPQSSPLPSSIAPPATQHHQQQLSRQQSLASFQSPSTLAQVVAPPVAAANAAPSFSSSLIAEPAPQQSAPLTQSSPAFGDQPEEQIEAPSFQHVLSNGCPRKGVFSWENKDQCDRYYMCTNGTFTEEACPNGLAYSQMGSIYQHCAYQWTVDCGKKKSPGPLASPGCPWQFGVFPTSANAQCSIDYFVCEWGVPEKKRCQPEGLFYDDRIKGCQWADQLGCKSEALLNFKCPPEDEDNPFWPFPRYYHTKQDIIVCVNEQPRLVHCTEDQVVEPSSLSCLDLKKKKKKF